MATTDFQQVRIETDLVALVGQRVPLKRQGVRWVGLCPFHDDHHPSLDVSQQHHTWRCWVCGVHGDAIDWVRLTENCSAVDALHRLAGQPPARPKGERLLDPDPRASRERRHQAYAALLQAAGLSDMHTDQLRQRGLSDEVIHHAAYASLPARPREPLLQAMRAVVPDLTGVPGVARDPKRSRWRLWGAPGLLIPVRDRHGQIQACQIRVDEGPARYQWMTSAPRYPQWTGTSPGTPFHVAGIRYLSKSSTWWVTEGPLKADVASFFLQAPVMGIPGVALWSKLARSLSHWRPPRVILAFDHDANPDTLERVQAAQDALGALLDGAGIRVEVARWDEGIKGLDDALQAHCPVKVTPWVPPPPD